MPLALHLDAWRMVPHTSSLRWPVDCESIHSLTSWGPETAINLSTYLLYGDVKQSTVRGPQAISKMPKIAGSMPQSS